MKIVPGASYTSLGVVVTLFIRGQLHTGYRNLNEAIHTVLNSTKLYQWGNLSTSIEWILMKTVEKSLILSRSARVNELRHSNQGEIVILVRLQ